MLRVSVSKTLTTYEFDLLQLALIRLLFHVLNAFRDLLRLRGVRFPALGDLSDGARVEIREGLREKLRAEASYAEGWRSIVGFWVARTVARLSWPGLGGMVVACVGC